MFKLISIKNILEWNNMKWKYCSLRTLYFVKIKKDKNKEFDELS